MDMQNVSNLQIPEGMVKTIHDEDSRLLWGAVGYDTKYAGNTTQVTYSGKNLAPSESVLVKNNPYNDMVFSKSVFIPAGTYSASISNIADATSWRFAFKFFYTDGTNVLNAITQGVVTFSINSMGDTYSNDTACVQRNNGTLTSLYFTTTVDTYVVPAIMGGDVSNSTTLNYQLEVGQSSSTYEPYTGGAPSPSPNYPQPVNVVTGAQTVTISDSIDSVAFPIGLGSIELCKIDSYQDYVYKSGEDWYIHKETAKIILDGSESWKVQADTHNKVLNLYTSMGEWGAVRSKVQLYCTIAGYSRNAGQTNNTYINICAPNASGTSFLLDLSKADFPTGSSFTAWLPTHNVTVYYILATPTNTKITDNALIGQLNAVHQWATRYGYVAATSGNLPIILRKDALQ